MSSLFDRFNAEIDQLGERVRTVFESSKLHLDRSALVGQRGKAAYKLGMLVYKEIAVSDLPRILWETIQNTVQVMFIISAASIFGFLLVRQQVPTTLVEGLMSLTVTPWVVLLIINIILLILGCFMEAIAIMLLTIPVFMPLKASETAQPRIGMSAEIHSAEDRPQRSAPVMTRALFPSLLT